MNSNPETQNNIRWFESETVNPTEKLRDIALQGMELFINQLTKEQVIALKDILDLEVFSSWGQCVERLDTFIADKDRENWDSMLSSIEHYIDRVSTSNSLLELFIVKVASIAHLNH